MHILNQKIFLKEHRWFGVLKQFINVVYYMYWKQNCLINLLAAYNGHIKMLRFLIKNKASLNASDEFGNTALSEGKFKKTSILKTYENYLCII